MWCNENYPKIKIINTLSKTTLRSLFKAIEKNKITIIKNTGLWRKSSILIGGKVKYLIKPATENELMNTLEILNEVIPRYSSSDILILGKLTKLITSDENFDFAIDLTNLRFFKRINEDAFEIGAGYPLPVAISKLVKIGASGIEHLAGIPGSVGGGVFMNAGTKGGSISDFISWVEVIDIDKLKIYRLQKQDCSFDYRFSIFQTKRNWIITKALFEFKNKEDPKLVYQRFRDIISYRLKTQPLGAPSIGSIFLNPSENLSAGKLLERAGAKKLSLGSLAVSNKHANFIINSKRKKASFADFLNLVYRMKSYVIKESNVKLYPEFNIAISCKKYKKIKKQLDFLYNNFLNNKGD